MPFFASENMACVYLFSCLWMRGNADFGFLFQGKLESEGMGWEESIVIMETMDQVRKQGGIKYPAKIETTEYPVSL